LTGQGLIADHPAVKALGGQAFTPADDGIGGTDPDRADFTGFADNVLRCSGQKVAMQQRAP
jgi:hypothetical protein